MMGKKVKDTTTKAKRNPYAPRKYIGDLGGVLITVDTLTHRTSSDTLDCDTLEFLEFCERLRDGLET